MRCADEQIERLEKIVIERVKLKPEFKLLKTVPGIGDILALTMMLETGDITRFPSVGDYASYCRCVGSKKISNGKKKGSGNTKNGNKYLGWAYVEAANFAIRFNAKIKSFLPAQEIQDQQRGGAQGRGPQAVPGLLLHHQRSGCVRY